MNTPRNTIAGIAPTPGADGTVPVTFDLAANPAGARPGLTVSLSVVVAQSDDVLHVPSGAVHGAGRGTSVIAIGADGARRSIPVTIGLAGDGTTAIVSGLHAGQRVGVGG